MELKKKTYITPMPNQSGAFLQASRCFAQLGVNLTRVSYNKAVDSHMLFIDAEGTEEQLHQADTLLRGIGYLPQTETAPQIILIAFYLRDVPGAVTEILTLIEQFVRPFSLALRLYGNLFGEEMVTEQLGELFPIILPLLMQVLSLLFCLIQAIVFTMLLSIYIGEAIGEE